MSTTQIDSIKMYLRIYVALLALMVLTIAIWLVDLGTAATVIAMAIAITKAVLVVLYFMHVRHASRLTWVFASAAFLWLGILICLTFNDYFTRGKTANHLELHREVARQVEGETR